MANNLLGFFENYSDGHIFGWACNTDSPNTSVVVELIIDEVPVLAAEANIFRADLRNAGYGDGSHALKMKVPAEYFDSAPHKVALRIKDSENNLPPSPTIIVFGHRADGASRNISLASMLPNAPTPLMSLIMPTYNRCAIMERTVRAYTLCSRWEEVELIVVDDGSRDATAHRLAQISAEHKNIRTVSIENSGPARARNLAASMARAPLLLFIGDDVEPVDQYFIETHVKAHEAFPDNGAAVLGKITWPSRTDAQVNFVMQHVQGEGQQQFGYKFMEPYRWYDWRQFYSSNLSLKRNIVSDWSRDGYDEQFTLAAYEDAELGYRLTQQQNTQGRSFKLLYVPAAVLAHSHPYSVASFIRRQVICGIMARRFFEKHPEIAAEIGIDEMNNKLREPVTDQPLPIEHYFTVFEGLKSWALILEQHNGLGSQNWHGDFLKAIFRLAYCEGYLRTVARADANLALAARCVLDRTIGDLNQAIFREIIGSTSPPKLV